MKALVFNMLTIAATFAAMTACTSESDPVDEVQTKGKTPIEFSSSILGVQTKAIVSDDQFQDGQKIGIYGYKTAEPSSDYLTTNFINNKEFTYSGSTFTATDAYWERDATHFFYAYYPVASTTADPTGYQLTEATNSVAPSVKVVCQKDSGIDQDLLWAQPASNGFQFSGVSVNNVSLPFSHKLSQVKFLIKLENTNIPTSALTKISLNVDKSEGSLNIITGELTETGSSVALSKTISSTDITVAGINCDNYNPLVLPSSIISDLKVTINNQELPVTLTTAPALVAGKITTITITVKPTNVIMETSITQWGDGGTPGVGEV